MRIGNEFRDVQEIKAAAEDAGSVWFSRETMKWHRTRLAPNACYSTPTGAVFVTSDGAGPREEDGRGYTVREATRQPFRVGTAEGHGVAEYGDLPTARHFARELAAWRKTEDANRKASGV